MAEQVDALQLLLDAERGCADRIAAAEAAAAERELRLLAELAELAEALEESLAQEGTAAVAALEAEHRAALAVESEQARRLADRYRGLDATAVQRAAERVLASLVETP